MIYHRDSKGNWVHETRKKVWNNVWISSSQNGAYCENIEESTLIYTQTTEGIRYFIFVLGSVEKLEEYYIYLIYINICEIYVYELTSFIFQ